VLKMTGDACSFFILMERGKNLWHLRILVKSLFKPFVGRMRYSSRIDIYLKKGSTFGFLYGAQVAASCCMQFGLAAKRGS